MSTAQRVILRLLAIFVLIPLTSIFFASYLIKAGIITTITRSVKDPICLVMLVCAFLCFIVIMLFIRISKKQKDAAPPA